MLGIVRLLLSPLLVPTHSDRALMPMVEIIPRKATDTVRQPKTHALLAASVLLLSKRTVMLVACRFIYTKKMILGDTCLRLNLDHS